jgi:hypothetical protein
MTGPLCRLYGPEWNEWKCLVFLMGKNHLLVYQD